MKRIEIVAKKPKMAIRPRPYQVEIATIAAHESVIAKLNTGLGKTFIAVMVIKDHLNETFIPISEGGKRIIFIAKTGIANFFLIFSFSPFGLSTRRVFTLTITCEGKSCWSVSRTNITNCVD